MNKLEIFYDYACPYCLKGYEYLVELLIKYPEVEVAWNPCEAHPRPERYGRHSDLLARGMYFALENNVDIMKYHDLMFKSALKDRIDIEDLKLISQAVSSILNVDDFYTALSKGDFEDKLLENNKLAWNTYGFSAVPSFCMNGKFLKSIENIGVTKESLDDFIKQNLIKS